MIAEADTLVIDESDLRNDFFDAMFLMTAHVCTIC